MTDSERAAHNLLARACYLLADIRSDLIQYENDSAAQGFVCDINDFFLESIAWLKEWETASLRRSALLSSAPVAGDGGPRWKAPTLPLGGPSSDITADASVAPPTCTQETGFAAFPPASSFPEASPLPPSTSSRRAPFPDFF